MKYHYDRLIKCRYEYINTIILDFITISIHQSSEGEYYGYFLALHDLLKATEYIGASGNDRILTCQISIPTACKIAEVGIWRRNNIRNKILIDLCYFSGIYHAHYYINGELSQDHHLKYIQLNSLQKDFLNNARQNTIHVGKKHVKISKRLHKLTKQDAVILHWQKYIN